ncbi:hypothetical protein NIES4071_99600 [Calothrix sp. NIES-4071]|nr:hypothetical protein NIES4071_99600 [Calothrix sp. NIES-4071]BAZ64223.1 hypothetical protein NIES4105_99530 [Calothrix sp. NIES-4105]
MYTNNDSELFNFSLTKIINALKTQDKTRVESCEKTLVALLGSNYTVNVFTAAILELSEIDITAFHWTIENFSHLKACNYLLEAVTGLTVKKLLKAGFIPGKDFSASQEQLLVNQEVRNFLMESKSNTERLLIQKFLLPA